MSTYYIATTGDDSTGDGSSALPWLTISKAYTESSGSDTIYIKDGTYDWITQTFEKSLYIKAVNDGSVIFDGGGTTRPWINNNNSIFIEITGIEFKNGATTGGWSFKWHKNDSDYYCKFTNCIFHDLYSISGVENDGGIWTVNAGGYFYFDSCLFYDLHCVDNTANNSWAGIITGRGSNTEFSSCSLYFNESGLNSFKYLTVSQNVATVCILKNTIIQNDGDAIARISGGTAGYTITPTYTCQNGNWTTNSCETGTGNITTDPLFVDTTLANFELQLDSPCISSGTLI